MRKWGVVITLSYAVTVLVRTHETREGPMTSRRIAHQLGMASLAAVVLALALATTVRPAAAQTKTEKPLAGYGAIVVEAFTIDKNPATEQFPKGLETMMQQSLIKKLREKPLFPEVVDATESQDSAAAAKAADPPERRLVLSGTVITFDPGSRAARYWGSFGAGQSKLKVRFVLRDAETGASVYRADKEGKFKGIFSFLGGSQNEAATSAVNGVVKALVNDVAQQR